MLGVVLGVMYDDTHTQQQQQDILIQLYTINNKYKTK